MQNEERRPRTTGEAAQFFGVPVWRVRRLLDAFHPDIPRIGQYRAIPPDLLPQIGRELEEHGWLPGDDDASDTPEPSGSVSDTEPMPA